MYVYYTSVYIYFIEVYCGFGQLHTHRVTKPKSYDNKSQSAFACLIIDIVFLFRRGSFHSEAGQGLAPVYICWNAQNM